MTRELRRARLPKRHPPARPRPTVAGRIPPSIYPRIDIPSHFRGGRALEHSPGTLILPALGPPGAEAGVAERSRIPAFWPRSCWAFCGWRSAIGPWQRWDRPSHASGRADRNRDLVSRSRGLLGPNDALREFGKADERAATVDLPRLKAGEGATISFVRLHDPSGKRLADLGFVEGARVEMVRSGDPCIVRIGHSRVGLGLGYQQRILLDPA